MLVEPTSLDGVLILRPDAIEDPRGTFSEVWNKRTFAKAGIDAQFVQDNQSLSRDIYTLRGLHYQMPPHAQDKLVRCLRGRILDVAVDIRRGSPTYGRSACVELSAENRKQLFVPSGFLHGFLTLCPDTKVHYKCSDYYAPDCDRAVSFSSPSLGIDWGVAPTQAKLSDKDRAAMDFTALQSPFNWT